MTQAITEQIAILQKCQAAQRTFYVDIRRHRTIIADIEEELAQAKVNLDQAKAICQLDTLCDDSLTNDAKRKAAVDAGFAKSQTVQDHIKEVQRLTRKLRDANDDLEKITNQRKACEWAQTAAGHIITAYQIEGVAHVSSSRQQPATSYANGGR